MTYCAVISNAQNTIKFFLMRNIICNFGAELTSAMLVDRFLNKNR